MTKEELVSAIYRMDPSYIRLKIDLNKFTDAELQKCYDRKMAAPASIRNREQRGGGWYTNYTPKTRTKTEDDGEGYYEVPHTEVKEKEKSIALTGFDALRKD